MNVVIVGKGVVCTLNEGDDFGKLALVNDAPRAATIITNEDNCQFLRVDKEDFNRIIRDAEANTARLKEHGRDVLLLRKMANKTGSNSSTSHYKYMVMAGTPEKMLEHLLETRIDIQAEVLDDSSFSWPQFIRNPLDKQSLEDTFLEDFLITHIVFLPTQLLCKYLLNHYAIDQLNTRAEKEFIMASKRRVIRFTRDWLSLIQNAFHQNPFTEDYLKQLMKMAEHDFGEGKNIFEGDLRLLQSIVSSSKKFREDLSLRGVHKWKSDLPGAIRRITNSGVADTGSAATSGCDEWMAMNARLNAIHPKDESKLSRAVVFICRPRSALNQFACEGRQIYWKILRKLAMELSFPEQRNNKCLVEHEESY